MSEYDDVISYLTRREYPEGLSKHEKRRLRERCESFSVTEGVLMHKGHKGKLARVVVDVQEKDRIVSTLHCSGVGGSHFGQSATIAKVTDRFWWKSVTFDVRDYVRRCQV